MAPSQQGRTSIIAMLLGSVTLIGLGMYLGLQPRSPQAEPPSLELENDTQETTSYGETADGVNDFGACNADTTTFCSDVSESIEASYKIDLVNCLYEHETELAPDCLASLDRRVALNEAVNESCKTERASLCMGVKPTPGSEPGNDCLWEHEAELSAECLEALMAHDCAKPVDQAEHCE